MIKINSNTVTSALIAFYTLIFYFILLKFQSINSANNCLVAGLIMLGNFLAITLLWKLIFNKKSIALAVLIIIFKYLILGVILWNLSNWLKIDPIGLVAGFSTLLVAILTTQLLKRFLKTN